MFEYGIAVLDVHDTAINSERFQMIDIARWSYKRDDLAGIVDQVPGERWSPMNPVATVTRTFFIQLPFEPSLIPSLKYYQGPKNMAMIGAPLQMLLDQAIYGLRLENAL